MNLRIRNLYKHSCMTVQHSSRLKCLVDMLTITIALALLAPTNAWYTCEELEFCANIRNSYGTSTYSLTNVQVSDQVHGRLVNAQTSETFSVVFSALEDDTFRLRVQDENGLRYSPAEDVLNGIPTQKALWLASSDNGVISVITDDDITINFYISPFYIEIIRGETVIIEVNKSNRLIINTSDDDEALALDISFPLASVAYGIPQHAEGLALSTTTDPESTNAFRLYNVDYYGYPTYTREALYGSIGVLYGVSTSITSGLFWMNSAQTFVDVSDETEGLSTTFISEAGALELFLFAGPTLQNCVRQYTGLTGVTPLPQYFTLGYHQSRYSYMTQEDVEEVVSEFDSYSFPMDVIWLDIDYTDGYKYFTWNYSAFPDPEGMQENVAETGRKVVAISDPHIKIEEGYFVYDEALAQDFFVKDSTGNNFEGECWPGMSSWIDYFNPDAREWYGELYLLEKFPNSTLNLYIWNDMNEPSVFNVDEQTMPGNLLHYGNIEHKNVHNLYGFKQTQATYEGLLKRDPTKRPFILSRSHFAGSQRYSAIWTGDNQPTWDHLRISIPMILTESLAGMVFCGADVGGFTDNVDEELLQRWYQAGVWYPFYRGHSSSDTDRREPYLYSEEVQQRIRSALRLRYVHIPYWYTRFFEHELTGDPVVRPLSYHYPNDETLRIDTQWLIGSDIMAAPVLYEGSSVVSVYFPGDENEYWYDFLNELVYEGGDSYVEIQVDLDASPYYYRGGSIIFRIDEDVRSTTEQKTLSYDIYIFLDSNLEATGTIYEDDFESFEYRDQAYAYYRFQYNIDEGLTMEQINRSAKFNRELIIKRVHVYQAIASFSKQDFMKVDVKVSDKVVHVKNTESKTKIEL